jgi:hypothetical protein|tara:strand:- start:67 stop:633 length:567 start_codon:yes stop_codon:yes gene_type:complete
MKKDVEYLKPTITEKRVWNQNHLFISLLIGLFIIIIFTFTINFVEMTLTQVLIFFLIIIIIYATILFFLLEPHKIREIQQPIIKILPPKEHIKTVYHQIPYETEKRIYITNPKTKQLNQTNQSKKTKPSKKFKFYASIKSGTYHTNTCRLARLMKKKYKIGKPSEKYFNQHSYKPCKVCILNQHPTLK